MPLDYLEPIAADAAESAEWYDELPLWSAPFGLLALERLPMRHGLTILDVGAGTGFLSIELAERCGAGTTVIAVDPWALAADRLRRKIAQRCLTNVRVVCQDAAALDLPAESVDVIVSNLGINNFEDPAAVLNACFRVARPGTTLLLTTNVAGHMAEFYEVFLTTLIELGARDRLPALEAHIAHRGTPESVADRVRAAGFSIVDIFNDTFRMRFADGSALLRHTFIRRGFMPGWKSIPAAGALEETFAALERNLNTFAATRGELALTIPMACLVARRPASERGV